MPLSLRGLGWTAVQSSTGESLKDHQEQNSDPVGDKQAPTLYRAGNHQTPKHRKTIWIAAGGAFLASAAFGVSVWLSPTWTAAKIVNAAKSGDQARLEQLIDFRSVRTSFEADLKDTMGAALRKEIASSNDPFAMLLSGLGQGITDAMATSIAEQLITPRALERAANGEELHVSALGLPQNVPLTPNRKSGEPPQFAITGRYLTASRYEYQLRPKAFDANIYVQMQRTGFFTWRADRIRLDPKWVEEFANEASKSQSAHEQTTNSSDRSGAGTQAVDLKVAAEEVDERVWALYEQDSCGDLVGPERTGCWEAEQTIQDRRLNAEYATLRSLLDGQNKEQLRQLQLTWIKSRDSKCSDPEFGYGAWATASCLAEETAKRRLFLQSYRP